MNIAVFCGSATGNDPDFVQSARILGEWIAREGHSLIYGGGESGLMGIMAGAAFRGGSHVTGILPGDVEFICSRPQPFCSEVIVTGDMSERKKKLLEMADMFIALPGGIGTLDEITEAITMVSIGLMNKPCVFLNTNGYYEPMRNMLEKMMEAGYFEPEVFSRVSFDTVEKYMK